MTETEIISLFPHGPATSSLPLVLTVEEAAERPGSGRTMGYALVSSGAVKSIRIGRLRRLPSDALVTFLEELRTSRSGGTAWRGRATAARLSKRVATITGTAASPSD